MPLLRMDTGEVGGVAANMRYSLEAIEENVHHIQSSANQLAWEAPAAYDFRNDILACCNRLLSLIDDGRGMVSRVSAEVSEWEENGQRFFGSPLNLSFLAIAGGGMPANLAAALTLISQPLAPIFNLSSTVLDKFPQWLKAIFTKRTPILPQIPDEIPPAWRETTQSPQADANQEKQASPSADAKPLDSQQPDSGAEQQPKDEPGHDVPIKSQIGLTYGKGKTGYGCVPTSASMVTDYWHQQDETNQTISAQDLLNKNAADDAGDGKHQFTATGMTTANLQDDLEPMGYEVDTVTGTAENGEAQLKALETAVEKGPVVAVVRLGLGKTGVPHAVVVTGFTEDGKVMVNDPYTASKQVFTLEDFDKSWGSNFGKSPNGTPYATRSYTTILPKQN